MLWKFSFFCAALGIILVSHINATEAYIPNRFHGGLSFFESINELKAHQDGFFFPAGMKAEEPGLLIHQKFKMLGYQQSHIMAIFPKGDFVYGLGYYQMWADDIPLTARGADLRPLITEYASQRYQQLVVALKWQKSERFAVAMKANTYINKLINRQTSVSTLGVGSEYAITDQISGGIWFSNVLAEKWSSKRESSEEAVPQDIFVVWRAHFGDFNFEIVHDFRYAKIATNWKLVDGVSFLGYSLIDRQHGEDFWMRQYGLGLGWVVNGMGLQYSCQWNQLDQAVSVQNNVGFYVHL